MGLLCMIGGAESTNQGCALKEAVGCVVLTLFARETGQDMRDGGCHRERKDVCWLQEGVVLHLSSQRQGRCEVQSFPLFCPKR